MRRVIRALAFLGCVAVAVPAGAELSFVGSWTMGEHLVPEAAAAFAAESGTRFGAVRAEGSVKGLDMVRRGQAPLAGVTRPLSPAERRHGFYYRVVGYDAVVVVVHPDNPVTDLTVDQLKAIYTGKITNWKQVGGRQGRIDVITEVWGGGHVPMVWFQTQIMDGVPFRADRKEIRTPRDRLSALHASAAAIATVSASFVESGARAIAIGGYAPDPQHVRSGGYLLSRPLLLVAPARPDADVRRFIDFMMSPAGQRIVARRFVAIR